MSKHNVVVIGNGIVEHHFIEELIDKAEPGKFALTVFSKDPRVAYDRVHLSTYFSINRDEKLIHSNTGRAVHYDTLIFATGSWPWIPPGAEGSDCFVYRTIEDLRAPQQAQRGNRRRLARPGSRAC